VLGYFEAEGIRQLWRQHTGHAIGLRNHEAPFLDVGDRTKIETGMVFTIEPGVYSPEVGGFRHSDTVHVTEDGIEILTDYPSELEALTIPAS
jgi:Xaa-Pro aminopeptidase